MKKRIALVAALLVAVATSPSAEAQRGRLPGGAMGGRGGPQMSADMMMLGLLRNDAVRDEVDIMPDQQEALVKAAEEMQGERPDFSRMRDLSQEERLEMLQDLRKQMEERVAKMRDAVEQILLPEQLERLNEIVIQLMGTGALNDPKIAEKLKLTEEQKEKMQEVREDARASMRDLFRGGDRENMREKMSEAREQEQEKIMEVLNSEQRQQFEEMQGKPSEAVKQMREGRRGGFGGRGGGRGGRGGGRGESRRGGGDRS